METPPSQALISASPPPRRLRMYSLEFKARVVEDALRPDTSVSLVARKYNVNANQVFAWRKQYREGSLRGSRPEPTVGLPAPESGFLPVGVLSAPRRTYRVEVKLPNGLAVRLDPDMPEAVLRKLVSTLAGVL